VIAGVALGVAGFTRQGRQFTTMPRPKAAAHLIDDGAYRLVRHPMYLGYFLTHLGFLLTNPVLWNAAVYVAWTACQLYRIRAEERVLSGDTAYEALARRTRYRLVPFVY